MLKNPSRKSIYVWKITQKNDSNRKNRKLYRNNVMRMFFADISKTAYDIEKITIYD